MNNAVDRSTIKVGADSWHHRAYEWWLAHGGRTHMGYRENLCHYMRVVFIWVPLFWFCKMPIYRWVRPWMIVGVMSLLATFVYGLLTSLDAILKFLLILAALVLIAVITFGVLFGIGFLHDKHPILVERIGKIIAAPVWGPVWLLFYGVLWIATAIDKFVYRHYGKTFMHWYLEAHILKVFYPWSVSIVLFFVGIGVVFGLDAALTVLTICAVGLVAFSLLVYWDLPDVNIDPLKSRGSSIWRIIWQFLVATKAKICPYIALPGEWEDAR